jgi:hypothetical protein
MKLITFTGTQGTSKTWLAESLFNSLIAEKHKAIIIPSITRNLIQKDLISGHSKEASIDDQFRILDAYSRVYSDIIYNNSECIAIVDRSFSDIVAYSMWHQIDNLVKDVKLSTSFGNLKKLASAFFTYYSTKTNLICYCKPYREVDNDGFRVTDVEYRDRIDSFIQGELSKASHLNLLTVGGEREDMLESLLYTVKEKVL